MNQLLSSVFEPRYPTPLMTNLTWEMGLGVLATVAALVAALLATRYSVGKTWQRETWGLLCRGVFFVWFQSLWWRAERSCGLEGTSFLFGVVPLRFPTLSLVHGLWPETTCALMPVELVYFPLAQIAYYLAELQWLAALAPGERRKDDVVLVIHHWLTIVCVGVSVYVGALWAVSLILSLYDLSDIVLDAAKWMRSTAKFLSKADKSAQLRKRLLLAASSRLFYVFVVVWFATRIYYVPVNIVISMWNDRFTHPHDFVAVHYVVWVFLCFIQLPQVVWTFLILRIAYRNAVGGSIKDDRDEDDD